MPRVGQEGRKNRAGQGKNDVPESGESEECRTSYDVFAKACLMQYL